MSNIRWNIKQGGGFVLLTISKLNKGDRLYAELGSMISSSTSIRRSLLKYDDLIGASEKKVKSPTMAGQFFSDFMFDKHETIKRQMVGEHRYQMLEALEDQQKVTFRSCFPGEIICWDSLPLKEDEYYLREGEKSKSIYTQDFNSRPHGSLIGVQGSFFLAEMGVKVEAYHTNNQDILNFSGTKDSFQKFVGTGKVFLEVHGKTETYPLYPGEAVLIRPGYLLAFTEGVSLEIVSAGDLQLRAEEKLDYMIKLTAGEKGGYVYSQGIEPGEFVRFIHRIMCRMKLRLD